MRVRIIDAFTDVAFAGNQAAACQIGDSPWPADAWLSAVAKELNLPMTAYVKGQGYDPEADLGLRWFMPSKEERRWARHGQLRVGR